MANLFLRLPPYLSLLMIALAIIKYFLLFLAIAFTFVMVVELIGRLLEANQKFSLSNSYFTSASHVFEVVSNPHDYPQWRNQVEEIQNMESSGNSWIESFGSVTLKMIGNKDSNGAQRFEAKSIDSRGFTFQREYVVYRQDKMTFLKIEDQLNFSSAFLRIFSQLFYDHSRFLKQELKNLDRIFS